MTCTAMPITALTISLLVIGCAEQQQKRWEQEQWYGPCHDESSLLATTAGSPNSFKCPNKDHRMRVQVATHPSNEEAAALVFCECARPVAPSAAPSEDTR